jgi:hypothetical protein
MREQLQVIGRPGAVIARPQEVIARRRASSRGPRGSFERPLRLQSGHRTVLPRRLALLALPLGVARERARVESLQPVLLRRAPLLPGGDEEVVRWPLWGRSVPIAVGVVGETTPSGGEMTSPRRLMTSPRRLMTSPRRHMTSPRRLMTYCGGETTPPRRLVTSSGSETTPRGCLIVRQRRGMSAARRLMVTRGRARTG